MNEKLKKQIMDAIRYCKNEYAVNQDRFAEMLDGILESNPTCGKEQRKFLDEIEKWGKLIKINQSIGFARNEDFDLEKVTKGE